MEGQFNFRAGAVERNDQLGGDLFFRLPGMHCFQRLQQRVLGNLGCLLHFIQFVRVFAQAQGFKYRAAVLNSAIQRRGLQKVQFQVAHPAGFYRDASIPQPKLPKSSRERVLPRSGVIRVQVGLQVHARAAQLQLFQLREH